MRIPLTTGRRVLFGAMVLAALIASLPMRLALSATGLDQAGLSARSATGPVWFATLREVHFGAVELGDVHAFLSPWQLLVGRARVDLVGPPPPSGAPARGAITVSRHSIGVDDVTASIPAGQVFAPLPVSRLDLTDVSVRFESGQCQQAEGRIRAALGAAIADIPIAQAMEGSARCEAGQLLVPLQSASGTEKLRLLIGGDGRYRAELVLVPSDDAAGQRLAAAGFVASPDGYRLSIEGRL